MSLCFKMARRLCLLVVVLFLFQIGASLAVEKDTPQGEKFSGVDFKDGLLKVSVEKQSFKEVMDKVAKKAGIKILIDNPVDEDLTISFDYLPLEKGLKQLLKDKNYAFKYRPEEDDDIKNSSSLINVFVLPKSEGLHGDDRQAMNMNEIQDKIKERIDEALATQGLAISGILQTNQIEEVLRKINEMGGFDKLKNVENEDSQIPATIKKDLVDKINKAMGKIRKTSEGIQVERVGGDDTK